MRSLGLLESGVPPPYTVRFVWHSFSISDSDDDADVTSKGSLNTQAPAVDRRHSQGHSSCVSHEVEETWEGSSSLIPHAAIAIPLLSRYSWNRGLLPWRVACAGRRWRLARMWDVIEPEAARTRGNPQM